MILREFFQSPSWKDIQTKLYTTFGLSGIGTVATAMPQTTASIEYTEQMMRLELMVKWLAVGSYILSGVVAITVIIRFIIWLYDRYKQNKKDK